MYHDSFYTGFNAVNILREDDVVYPRFAGHSSGRKQFPVAVMSFG